MRKGAFFYNVNIFFCTNLTKRSLLVNCNRNRNTEHFKEIGQAEPLVIIALV